MCKFANSAFILLLSINPPRHPWPADTDGAEIIRPNAGDLGTALGAGSLSRQSIIHDNETITLDQPVVAIMAIGMLVLGQPSRKVSGVHLAQPGFHTDFGSTFQDFRGGARRIGHFVIGVEGGHMPGDVRGYRGDKSGRVHQFIGGIVEAGHH